jgi:hypothetical protein
MDRGIWATWYDLDEEDQPTFLEWAHRDYLPALRSRPGYAWAAHYRSDGGGQAMTQMRDTIMSRPAEDVGAGSEFLMLVGAPSPHVFLGPSVLALEQEAPDDVRIMLSCRRRTRTAIFCEEARVNGPDAAARMPGTTPAPAIQLGSFRVRSVEEEFDLGCWYAQYRLPHMAQMNGCIATRKLLCVAGWVKHAILYEFTSLEARMMNFERPHEAFALDPKEWTGRVARYTVHAPGSPMVATRIWPIAAS